jgi:chorismate synthase
LWWGKCRFNFDTPPFVRGAFFAAENILIANQKETNMPGNTFGTLFKITSWGESHGKGVGVVVDGCPPKIPLDEAIIQAMLDRRRPGRSPASTTRMEPDQAIIMSGVFNGVTTGTPIMIMVENKDAHPKAYEPYADIFRPGHGDITYMAKYGIRDWRGGGRASARETVARVAAGSVAKALLKHEAIEVNAYTIELGGVRVKAHDLNVIDKNMFFSPDMDAAEEMKDRVVQIKKKGDSIGGIVEVLARGVPPGLGDPVFDKIDADLAKALMSIGAIKGVEIGSGFGAASKLGSENNDEIIPQGFSSNNAGGILAGISNGDDIVIRAAVKPIPSILVEQNTIDGSGKATTIATKGRHDVSAIPRINVVCEAMVSLVLADHLLRQRAVETL